MAMYAYTMYGASLTPAILAALLMKRVSPFAATLSIIVGMLVTIVFECYSTLTGTKILGITYCDPSIILSVSTLLILNMLIRKKYKLKCRYDGICLLDNILFEINFT